jgi:HSP20 family protein
MNTHLLPTKISSQPLVRRAEDALDAMRREIDQLFERFGDGFSRPQALSANRSLLLVAPDVDVRETDKELVIDVELPGVSEKDISVAIQNGMLVLKGEKKDSREEKNDNYYLMERTFGSFERTFKLPPSVDETKIEANFKNGILNVSIKKNPDAIKPERKIEIKRL